MNCEAGPCTEKLTVIFVATLAHLGHFNNNKHVFRKDLFAHVDASFDQTLPLAVSIKLSASGRLNRIHEHYADGVGQLSYFFCEELVDASLTGVCARPSACSFSQNSFKGSSKIYLPLITPTTDPNKTLLSREALDRLNDGCETELHLNGIGWNRVCVIWQKRRCLLVQNATLIYLPSDRWLFEQIQKNSSRGFSVCFYYRSKLFLKNMRLLKRDVR